MKGKPLTVPRLHNCLAPPPSGREVEGHRLESWAAHEPLQRPGRPRPWGAGIGFHFGTQLYFCNFTFCDIREPIS